MYLEQYTHIRVPFYVYDMRAVRLSKIKFYAVYGRFGLDTAASRSNLTYQEIQKERRRLHYDFAPKV